MERNVKQMIGFLLLLLFMGIFTVLLPYEVTLEHIQILSVWNLTILIYFVLKDIKYIKT